MHVNEIVLILLYFLIAISKEFKRSTHYIIDCLCIIGVERMCYLPLSISSISNVFVMFSPLMKLSAEHVYTPKSLKRTLSMVIVSL